MDQVKLGLICDLVVHYGVDDPVETDQMARVCRAWRRQITQRGCDAYVQSEQTVVKALDGWAAEIPPHRMRANHRDWLRDGVKVLAALRPPHWTRAQFLAEIEGPMRKALPEGKRWTEEEVRVLAARQWWLRVELLTAVGVPFLLVWPVVAKKRGYDYFRSFYGGCVVLISTHHALRVWNQRGLPTLPGHKNRAEAVSWIALGGALALLSGSLIAAETWEHRLATLPPFALGTFVSLPVSVAWVGFGLANSEWGGESLLWWKPPPDPPARRRVRLHEDARLLAASDLEMAERLHWMQSFMQVMNPPKTDEEELAFCQLCVACSYRLWRSPKDIPVVRRSPPVTEYYAGR